MVGGWGGRGYIWELPSTAHVFSHLTLSSPEVGIVAHLYNGEMGSGGSSSLPVAKLMHVRAGVLPRLYEAGILQQHTMLLIRTEEEVLQGQFS